MLGDNASTNAVVQGELAAMDKEAEAQKLTEILKIEVKPVTITYLDIVVSDYNPDANALRLVMNIMPKVKVVLNTQKVIDDVNAKQTTINTEAGEGQNAVELVKEKTLTVNDFWAHDQIAWAYDNGYMNGYNATTFGPSGSVTHEQLWMVLARISGENPADMAAARDRASNNVSDGSNPKNSISRQQMVIMLYRYAQLNDYNTAGGTTLDTYHVVQSYTTDAMFWAVDNGIVNGTNDGCLDPEGTAIRAQFAVILYRFCDTIVK